MSQNEILSSGTRKSGHFWVQSGTPHLRILESMSWYTSGTLDKMRRRKCKTTVKAGNNLSFLFNILFI